MSFEKIIDGVVEREKGFVNHPADRGGPTNWGITQAVARANGFMGDMRDLPLATARAIYFKRYITEPKFDQVGAVDMKLAEELIDTGVNMGPHRAAEFLQRWLNGFNDTGSRYGNLFVDGRIGPMSIDALRKFLVWRGVKGSVVMMRALNSIQAVKYLEITEANPSQKAFLFGWMDHRVQM